MVLLVCKIRLLQKSVYLYVSVSGLCAAAVATIDPTSYVLYEQIGCPMLGGRTTALEAGLGAA